jgi:hypothetical protein
VFHNKGIEAFILNWLKENLRHINKAAKEQLLVLFDNIKWPLARLFTVHKIIVVPKTLVPFLTELI